MLINSTTRFVLLVCLILWSCAALCIMRNGEYSLKQGQDSECLKLTNEHNHQPLLFVVDSNIYPPIQLTYHNWFISQRVYFPSMLLFGFWFNCSLPCFPFFSLFSCELYLLQILWFPKCLWFGLVVEWWKKGTFRYNFIPFQLIVQSIEWQMNVIFILMWLVQSGSLNRFFDCYLR